MRKFFDRRNGMKSKIKPVFIIKGLVGAVLLGVGFRLLIMRYFLPVFLNFQGDVDAIDWTPYKWLGETQGQTISNFYLSISLAPLAGMLCGCVIVLFISLLRRVHWLNPLVLFVICVFISRLQVINYVDGILGIGPLSMAYFMAGGSIAGSGVIYYSLFRKYRPAIPSV